jgi:protein SCO1/2/putative membrane protein
MNEAPRDPLEKLWTWGMSVFGVAVIATVLVILTRDGDVGENFDDTRVLADFKLTERSGETISTADVRGKVLVVSFVFTSCSFSCIEVNRRMSVIQKATAEFSDVQLLSVSIDPRTDTPELLGEFANRFGADADRWLFLTGAKAPVYSLIETSFLERDAGEDSLVPGGFSHTDDILVLDKSGRVRQQIRGLRQDTVLKTLEAVTELRKENTSS